jgi:membrane associated rhomboid family serine protease
MGIYDRDYYRRERPSVFGLFDGTGRVCVMLIVVTSVIFLIQLQTRVSLHGFHEANSGPFTSALEFNANAVLHGQVWRLLTYAFLHDTGNIWHIVFNMFLFFLVGREIEGIYGSKEFLAFYLVGAICGGIAQLGVGGIMVGASGAVTATLVLFALHFPTRIFYFMFVIPVPALMLVALYVLFDLLGLVSGARGGVAVACHLGGAAFGFLYHKFDWRILRFMPRMPDFKRLTQRKPRLRVFRGESDEEAVAVHAGARSLPDSQLEAELDAVLEKVSRHGKSSLTDREQKILMRASEIYRNKRK